MRNVDLVPEAPTSFDDMIAKGTAAGVQYPFVVGLDPANADPYHLYPFETSFGNSVFARNADGSYDGSQLSIGDEAGQAFAAWLGAQGAAGTINLNLTQDLSKEAFNSGQTPFILTGPWNVADAEAKGIKIAVDPIPSAGPAASPRSLRGFAGLLPEREFAERARRERVPGEQTSAPSPCRRRSTKRRPDRRTEGGVREGRIRPDHRRFR